MLGDICSGVFKEREQDEARKGRPRLPVTVVKAFCVHAADCDLPSTSGSLVIPWILHFSQFSIFPRT